MALVLAMEDEPNIKMILQVILEDEGHEVIIASNGLEGWEKLNNNLKPDVILVDLSMPVMTGKEVVEKIKTNLHLKDIPVVLLTGSTQGLNNFPHSDYYTTIINKPFDLNEITETIKLLT